MEAVTLSGGAILSALGAYSARKAIKTSKVPYTGTGRLPVVQKQEAEIAREDLLRRLAKLRRATQLSELSEPNVKRKTLGAG